MPVKRYDSRDLAPYADGRFTFTVHGDRVWWRYIAKRFGVRIRASSVTSNSSFAIGVVMAFEHSRADDLVSLVRFHMGDIPGAVEAWEHIARVAALGPVRKSPGAA